MFNLLKYEMFEILFFANTEIVMNKNQLNARAFLILFTFIIFSLAVKYQIP